MPDSDVETVLREIRAQVLANQEHNQSAASALSLETSNGEKLAAAEEPIRIDAQLSTIARAWNRLPPVVSNRRGTLARLELWLKGLANNALRWFTWEQVNFNAAVHHALKDTQEAFSILEHRLLTLQSELKQGLEIQEAEIRAQRQELERQLERQLERLVERQTAELTRHSKTLEEIVGELRTITALKNQTSDIDRRLIEFAQEVRESNERLIDEQRVCFKQLSLEAGENALQLDRTRRDLEARLEKVGKSSSDA